MDIVIIWKCVRIQTFPKWWICILGTWVNDRNLAPGHVHNTKKIYVRLNMKIYLKENRTYKYVLLFLQRPHRTYCGNISKMPFSKYNLKTHFFFLMRNDQIFWINWVKLNYLIQKTESIIWSLISKSKFDTENYWRNWIFIPIWRYGRDLFQPKIEYEVPTYLYTRLFIWLFCIFHKLEPFILSY